MTAEAAMPFESVESAHEFLSLLCEVVIEAKREIEADVEREISSHAGGSRRLDAMRTACYSLQKLETHITKSCRILNDLRSLRRLLFEERNTKVAVLPVRPVRVAALGTPAKRPPARSTSPVRRNGERIRTAVGA